MRHEQVSWAHPFSDHDDSNATGGAGQGGERLGELVGEGPQT